MLAPYGVLHAFSKLSFPVLTNHLPGQRNTHKHTHNKQSQGKMKKVDIDIINKIWLNSKKRKTLCRKEQTIKGSNLRTKDLGLHVIPLSLFPCFPSTSMLSYLIKKEMPKKLH